MSTPLVTALRESGGYLCDGGYHQTAQLMTLAADEIERLNRELHTLQTASRSSTRHLPAEAPHHIVQTARKAVPFAGR